MQGISYKPNNLTKMGYVKSSYFAELGFLSSSSFQFYLWLSLTSEEERHGQD